MRVSNPKSCFVIKFRFVDCNSTGVSEIRPSVLISTNFHIKLTVNYIARANLT